MAVRDRRFRPRSTQVLVVIGNGMAGYKLCERLVSNGGNWKYHVVVFGEESQPAYDRVHLTQCLQGRNEEQLLLAPREWYLDNGIELFTGDPAVAVDRKTRTVRTQGGRVVGYDRLVFATGSNAVMPAVAGASLPGVFRYRTLRDLNDIKSYAHYCRRAAVLGGGLLGLEVAHALKQIGLDTWVVERGVGLLARQLDPEGSLLLQSQVERIGLRVLTHTDTERIEAIGPDRLVQFTNGQCLRVQMVVAAAGIRPRDELAAACGLEVAPRGGIVVNEILRTVDPNVFAIGECASFKGTVYGLAAPAYRMADALASSLVGAKKRFQGCDLSIWLKLPDLCVFALGDYQREATDLVHRNPGGCRRLVFDGSRLVGAVAVGDWSEQGRVQELIERRGRVWGWQRSRFLRTGCLWRGRVARPVSEWPASALICNCIGVRRAVLTVACANGCSTVEQLAQATGASTVCGSCRPLLAQLVGAPAVRMVLPGVNWLLRASITAFVLALAIWLMTPISVSESVQQRVHLEALWFNNVAKQITGFTLLGLALLSLLLSLRKRFKRFKLGEVGHWRAIHAGLGICTLLALVAHTGFRMGENLNFILMTNFLVLTLVGACAGAVNALDARLEGPAARRLRALWTWGHVGLTWPLPMLVLAHVLVSYVF